MRIRVASLSLAVALTVLSVAYPCHGQKRVTRIKLRPVRIAALYENLTDGVALGRSVEDTVRLFKATGTDFVFRAFWRWTPVVESPEQVPPGLLELAEGRADAAQAADFVRSSGHHYQALRTYLSGVKRELPSVLVCGAIPAQRLNCIERNDITGRLFTRDETWAMSADPTRWHIERDGRAVTREDFQSWWYRQHPYGGISGAYDRGKAMGYLPDITNPKFQELFLSWARKQIDCGVDAIWIDMLYAQALCMARITGDVAHPSVQACFAASGRMVEEIRQYGRARGRTVFVGTWGFAASQPTLAEAIGRMPYPLPDLDFVTLSPTTEEIMMKRLDTQRWKTRLAVLKKRQGDLPVLAFIDWGFDDSQLVAFSQKLKPEEQREVLKAFDRSFRELGVTFVYPVHGGYMGRGPVTTKLAYGKFRVFDSSSPEFDLFGTIGELARGKAKGDERSRP